MKHKECTVKTADGLSLYAQAWEPTHTPPKALICLIHGLGEHSSRYDELRDRIIEEGFILFAYDQRGHGRSPGKRGLASVRQLIQDIDQTIKQSGNMYPELPIFLYGHSMGGNLVLNYITSKDNGLKGAIATSPFIRTAFPPPAWKIALGKIVYKLYPSLTMSNELDPNGISKDKKVVFEYLNDPLVHDRISSVLGIDLIKSGELVLRKADQVKIPLLLMHGQDDPLTSAQASAEFAQKAKDKCSLNLWPHCLHELHHEPEKEEIFNTLLGWLCKHLS